jgi:hypothetical protein
MANVYLNTSDNQSTSVCSSRTAKNYHLPLQRSLNFNHGTDYKVLLTVLSFQHIVILFSYSTSKVFNKRMGLFKI